MVVPLCPPRACGCTVHSGHECRLCNAISQTYLYFAHYMTVKHMSTSVLL